MRGDDFRLLTNHKPDNKKPRLNLSAGLFRKRLADYCAAML